MTQSPCRCLAISDFNLENLAGLLNNDPDAPSVQTTTAPYGQPMQILMDATMACWQPRPDVAVIWTQPQSVVPSFGDVLQHLPVPLDRILGEVDQYAAVLIAAGQRAGRLLVPAWIVPAYHRGLGILDLTHEMGLANVLMRMNLRLAEQLRRAANIYLLNPRPWLEHAGKYAFNPKLWYMAKAPFAHEVFQAAAKEIKAAVRVLQGESKKLIILDGRYPRIW
jgi:predicted enzyme involved in methoxymalonyl-ACP biosynthesis